MVDDSIGDTHPSSECSAAVEHCVPDVNRVVFMHERQGAELRGEPSGQERASKLICLSGIDKIGNHDRAAGGGGMAAHSTDRTALESCSSRSLLRI